MVKFGKEWFTESWLELHEEFYYSDMYPYGKTHANKGRVSKLKIEDNLVSARVKSDFGTFTASFEIRKFSVEEKEMVLDLIKSNPEYLKHITNNSIHSKLELDLLDRGIFLVDSVIDMRCECGLCYDFPCEHVSALIYQLSLEFDKDPLLIFKLKGLDIEEELNIVKENKIQTVRNFFKKDSKKYEDKPVRALNYSIVSNLESQTFSLLQDNPSFYDKNFKSILSKLYRSFRKYPKKFLKVDKSKYHNYTLTDVDYESSKDFAQNFENKWDCPKKWNSFKFDINDKFLLENNNIHPNFTSGDYLLSFLAEFHHYADHNQYNDYLKFLHQVFLFTCELISKSAIVPYLFKSKKFSIVRWFPALYNGGVNNFLDLLYEMAPDDMVTFKGKQISKSQQTLALIAILVHCFLGLYSEFAITSELSKNFDNPIFDLFLGFLEQFKGQEKLIQNWISDLHRNDYKIYFEFDLEEDYITLDLKVDDKRLVDALANPAGSLELYRDISIIEKHLPEIDEIIITGETLKYDSQGFLDVLENTLAIFEDIGMSVVLPKAIQKHVTPKLYLKAEDNFNVKSYMNQKSISSFNWQVSIGDNVVSVEEFEDIVKSSEDIVKIASNYVILNKKETEDFLKKIEKINQLNQFEMMQTVLSSSFQDIEVNIDDDLRTSFDSLVSLDDVEVPKTVNATLRPYQKVGFSWMVQNIGNGFGSILADDMGLGKTLQTLATIDYFKNQGYIENKKVLIVVPNGLLFNWLREVEKFTPHLNASIYHGPGREIPKDYDILLTTYGILRSDLETINSQDWFLMVIDEAQNIKNPNTKQTKAVKSVESDNMIALSGTPVENRLSEYWSIFDFTNPNYLPASKKFNADFIKPIENERDRDVLEKFKKITEPFILRRLKSDRSIIDDLPDKIVNDVYCNLTVKQAAIYQETLDTIMEEVKKEDGIDRKGLILKLITSLKQICNHPSQFSKSDKFKINESGKMEVLISLLDNILANGEKVIIFTQYVAMGNIIESLIEKHFKTEVGFLHGGLNKNEKDDVIDKFQNGDGEILIASLKTGGTGLNLTAATNVIHYDLWWNPAVENQATDRAYRIGQNENVMVYRFITTGTFEEKIDEVIKQKQELADLAVSTNETFITEMNDDELASLLKLRN